MEEEDLYDEFGNYIGPNLEENENEEEEKEQIIQQKQQQQQSNDNKNQHRQEEIIQEKELEEEHRIVLHEDKQYYPDMDEVYPNAENLVMEEDIQPITEPIIAPIKQKEFDRVEKEIPSNVYNLDYLKELSLYPELIRNVGVVGHLHHGKSSLMDIFVQQTHQKDWINEKDQRYTDSRLDEIERLLSIKAKPMTFLLPNSKDKSYVINAFDTPGHVNFSDEICSALTICDGVVLVVDAVEGMMMGTERLIKFLVWQKIKIVVLLNKIDRLIIELKLPPQDAYLKIKHTLEEINQFIQKQAKIYNQNPEDLVISPLLGNVVFGATQFGFVFTLQSQAEMYAKNFKLDQNTFVKVLWGNYYYNRDAKTFKTQADKQFNKRTFVEFILEPLYKIFSYGISKEIDQLKPILDGIGVYLNKNDYKMNTRPLLKLIFQQFFGNSRALIDSIAKFIPNAKEGTETKVALNYLGDRNKDFYPKLLACDKNGPLIINIVKQYNKPDCLSFDVLGRVISGTIKKGDTVKVLGENYNIEDEEDMAIKEIKNLYIYQTKYRIEINSATAGNWVLIEGIEQSITKSATIILAAEPLQIEVFRPVRHNTTPVIKVAIEPLVPSELPKMLEGIRKVNKSYPQLITKVEDSGEHILIGTGELYMDCVLHDLRKMYSEIEIKVSDPSVSFCETVIDTSQIKCYSMTPNKQNKITMLAQPLDKGLANDIEAEKIILSDGKKKFSKFFQENYKWDLLASRGVWSFGPGQFGSNILLDDTLPSETNKTLLESCKDTIVQGFQWAAREGPLCDEPIRNVKFKIIEANISTELLYRGGGQIIPTSRRTCYSSFLMANPRMMEPYFFVEIQCSADALEAVVVVIGRRRGHILSEIAKPGSPLYTVKAHIPAIDSFGFETDLRVHTSGQAFCLQAFDYWELLPGDPLDKSIKLSLLEPSPPQDLAREFMIKTRRRKGLNENVSIIQFFDDDKLLDSLKQNQDLKDYI